MIFAKIMKHKKGIRSFLKKTLHKYRFVVMTDDSFEEKISVKLTPLKIIVFSGLFIFFCFFFTFFLIKSTTLKEFIPGRESKDVQREIITLSLKSDSLTQALNTQEKYLQNVQKIIGGNQMSLPKKTESFDKVIADFSFEKSVEDSLLRVVVENSEKGSIIANNKNNNTVFVFFTPINGFITDRFNLKKKHFGIDLVAKEKTRISSVLEGVVVISTWTSETGYIIGVQHKNGFLSLYKHNSTLLKSVGDFVSAGEHVAIIGNSGELSSGPHLHFELWYDGVPVNPEDYILF